MNTEKICLADLEVDYAIQPRENGLNQDHVEELATAYRSEAEVPRPRVWKIGTRRKLSQGFHRIEGAKRAKLTHLDCEVLTGTEAECAIDAAGSNRDHGLKRTNADKRQAVRVALKAMPDWTDARIADQIKVSQPLVREVRSEQEPQLKELLTETKKPAETKRKGKDGKEYRAKRPESAAKPGPKPKAEKPKPGEAIVITEEDEAEELARRKRPDAPKDALGQTIPPELRDTFLDPELNETIADLERLWDEFDVRYQRVIKSLSRKPYPFCHFGKATEKLANIVNPSKGDLRAAIDLLKAGIPYAVCTCKGTNRHHADCRTVGYLPLWRYEELHGKAGA